MLMDNVMSLILIAIVGDDTAAAPNYLAWVSFLVDFAQTKHLTCKVEIKV